MPYLKIKDLKTKNCKFEINKENWKRLFEGLTLNDYINKRYFQFNFFKDEVDGPNFYVYDDRFLLHAKVDMEMRV